jgi:hypothetical protein
MRECARTVLCGGRSVMAVPTASTWIALRRTVTRDLNSGLYRFGPREPKTHDEKVVLPNRALNLQREELTEHPFFPLVINPVIQNLPKPPLFPAGVVESPILRPTKWEPESANPREDQAEGFAGAPDKHGTSWNNFQGSFRSRTPIRWATRRVKKVSQQIGFLNPFDCQSRNWSLGFSIKRGKFAEIPSPIVPGASPDPCA